MIKNRKSASIITLILLLTVAFLGCSGGGSDATVVSSTSSQAIEVLPSSYDFGSVTPGNSPAPLVVKIINNGSGPLSVTDIALSDTDNFALDLSGVTNPCNAASSTIAGGSSCNAGIAFQPTSNASFDTNLTINSNDPVAPEIIVPLSGTREAISAITVRINQVETCPGPVVTSYVSVTDQGGYPVTGLTTNDFSVTETGGYVGAPTGVSFVSNTATLSVALVMDYSTSISRVRDRLDDMEDSAAAFVDQLRNQPGVIDEAEVIKFGPIVEVVQDFSSDKDDLKTAIYALWDNGAGTRLYDAAWQAVDDTAARSNDRRAVIIITDGENSDVLSTKTLAEVIEHAQNNGVPIFTVGLGDIVTTILQQLAEDTGGQFFIATTSDNLKTIYQQLADVLFVNQYILTYTTGLGANGSADLTIGATFLGGGITGDDTKAITSCP